MSSSGDDADQHLADNAADAQMEGGRDKEGMAGESAGQEARKVNSTASSAKKGSLHTKPRYFIGSAR